METILPILFIIAMFILQAVSNYRKEQEKARKRNAGRPASYEPVERKEREVYKPLAVQAREPIRENQKTEPARRVLPLDEVDALNEEEGLREGDVLEKFRSGFDIREAIVLTAILERPHK